MENTVGEQGIIPKKFYRDFCPCSEWEKQWDVKEGREFISRALSYNPNVCPFCGKALQKRLLFTRVKLISEDDGNDWCYATLKEFKQLLKEVI